MKEILVTGVGGFVGHHLSKELFEQGHRVIGTDRGSELPTELSPYIAEYFGGTNLTDAESVAQLPLNRLDAIINLAGLAQVGASFDKDAATQYSHINVAIHTVLADRLLKLGKTTTRVVAVSTGAVYDNHQSMPLTESSKLASDASPYALSKIAMEYALKTRIEKGLNAIIVRPFNHIGPGQGPGFLVPDLISQIMTGDKLVVGNLDTERDYTDVRDVVKAYVLLATQSKLKHNLYNVASGESVSGKTILEMILAATSKKATVVVDQSKIRPDDPRRVVGNSSRLRQEQGWQPQISLSHTIDDIVKEASNFNSQP